MALFGGGKPDHPMADAKQAKKLIAELPANDAAKALEEVTFWLDSIVRTEGFKLDYRYELFDWLDQAAKNHHRKLNQEYLATDRQEKFRENKLWTTVFEFWKMLSQAYGQCVEQFQSGASGAGAIKKDLPTIIARALRALTLQLKWILLHYGPIDDRMWSDLGRLYLFAEAKGMTTAPVEIYPGAHGQGTVQNEFLKALMLGVSSTDGLTPLKQEIAERTVAHFGELYTLQPKPAPGCNYFFDLSMRKPAARVQKSIEPNKMTRYFGAGKALPALERLMQEIKVKDGMPSHVNLGGTYDLDLIQSVMQHLALYWSDHPPARGSERRKIATRLTVVHGFRQVVKSVAPADDETSLDFQAKDSGESWIVENVSEGGFGAIIPQVKGDWIKVGSLLGVQTETAQFWGAGVVRRMARDEYQQRRVGIQLLSKAVIPVKLSPAGSVSSFNATRGGDPALLLSTTPDKNSEIALLLRAGSFTPGQGLEMNVRGKPYYLMPSKLVEGGDDFDWAKFRILQRQ
jgi:hypothetical protein